MKSRLTSVIIIISLLLIFTFTGICQDKVSASDLVDKVGQSSINWSAAYIEAVGIGSPPEKSAGKINARPIALRAAKEDAMRNLLEITKGVQVDSAKSVKDFTAGNNAIDTQVNAQVKGAEVVDRQYMPDGKAEVKLRMPLYGNLAQIIMPLAMVKPSAAPALTEAAPAPAVEALESPSATVVYTGIVIDARGIQARPAMLPKIFDEDGKEVYGLASVDLEYAVKNGMSGYAHDLTAAQSNQRAGANPITIKALRTSGPGKSDIIISNADAQNIRLSAESATFLKQCKVVIVLD
ncbi:MAG: hypothetical protein ABSF13_00310 [Smithella sp.]|jgi:hypothetical protein